MQDPKAEIDAWLARFGAALAAGGTGAADLFAEDGYWRDLLAFTWTIHTLEGRPAIAAMLTERADDVGASGWVSEDGATRGANGTAEGLIRFETAQGAGRGHVRIQDGRAVTLLTTLQSLKGFEEKRGPTRDRGVEHGVQKGRKSWLERRQDEEASLGHSVQPYCLIIGGGQGGIGLGARLKRLGVPTLIIDKRDKPGDTWRSRYKSLCLHDPVWYNHLPYLPFPDHWPVFIPKDQIGDWLEAYAKVMELNYWGATEALSATYDEAQAEWTVTVRRDGQTIALKPKQVVVATGMSGFPQVPDFPGMADFKGEQHHSSGHRGGEGYAGKRCVVIGSNNSAHDIAADLWENGAEVTMVQRSSTLVVKSETLMEFTWGRLFSEAALAAGITTDKADILMASMPYGMLPKVQKPVYELIQKRDADLYDRLRARGFMLDFGEDGTGLGLKYLRRGSGYYIDVGASELIANGSVKLRSSVAVKAIEADGVRLDDGSLLAADLIVYATGYGPMSQWVEKLVSKEAADKVGPIWGLGSGTTRDPGPWAGELRAMWKPTGQPGLWLHGGNLQQSRHYSSYLALQLKARMEGLPTPVYLAPVPR
jgi:putative flavoprotein involved in K+ transport